MPNINSALAVAPLDTLCKVFKAGTPVLGRNPLFELTPPARSRNNLLQFDPTKFQVQLDSGVGRLTLQKETNAGATTNARYLPWKENHCTGMTLDPAARLFLSGPFGGCCFFMAKDMAGGRPVVLHANDSNHKGDRAGALAAQRSAAEQYLLSYHTGSSLEFHVGYEQMGRHVSWVVGADAAGDGRVWDLYCVTVEPLGTGAVAVKYLGGWMNV